MSKSKGAVLEKEASVEEKLKALFGVSDIWCFNRFLERDLATISWWCLDSKWGICFQFKVPYNRAIQLFKESRRVISKM